MRKRRGWDAAQFAARLGVDRSTVTKLESGARGVSLDDAFAYAGTLGVHPSVLMAPMDSTPVQVSPGDVIDGHLMRAWLRGHAYVRPDGVDYFPPGVDFDEWINRWNWEIIRLIKALEDVLAAVEEAVAPESEPAKHLLDRLDGLRSVLEQLQHVQRERNDQSSASRKRIRGTIAGQWPPPCRAVLSGPERHKNRGAEPNSGLHRGPAQM